MKHRRFQEEADKCMKSIQNWEGTKKQKVKTGTHLVKSIPPGAAECYRQKTRYKVVVVSHLHIQKVYVPYYII
jgi:hypothetical protein